MALRRRVTPIEDGAETLRRGSVRGSARVPNSFHPCGAASARPDRDRGQSKLVPGDVACTDKVSAQHNVQPGRQICHSPIASRLIGEFSCA